MTEIVVFSDTHGRYDLVKKLVEHHEKTAKLFLFCGDGYPQIQTLLTYHPNLPIRCVRGNCDPFECTWPVEDLVEVDGVKIFFTHGHKYRVGYGLEELEETARDLGANIACYGHTHVRLEEYHRGLYLFNPGSAGRSRMGKNSYGVLELSHAGIFTRICDL